MERRSLAGSRYFRTASAIGLSALVGVSGVLPASAAQDMSQDSSQSSQSQGASQESSDQNAPDTSSLTQSSSERSSFSVSEDSQKIQLVEGGQEILDAYDVEIVDPVAELEETDHVAAKAKALSFDDPQLDADVVNALDAALTDETVDIDHDEEFIVLDEAAGYVWTDQGVGQIVETKTSVVDDDGNVSFEYESLLILDEEVDAELIDRLIEQGYEVEFTGGTQVVVTISSSSSDTGDDEDENDPSEGEETPEPSPEPEPDPSEPEETPEPTPDPEPSDPESPSEEPTDEPTDAPSEQPDPEPEPSEPSTPEEPTDEPTEEETPEPTPEPEPEPTDEPDPEPSKPEVIGERYIVGDALFTSRAISSSTHYGTIPATEVVEYHGDNGGNFAHISYDGKTGYVPLFNVSSNKQYPFAVYGTLRDGGSHDGIINNDAAYSGGSSPVRANGKHLALIDSPEEISIQDTRLFARNTWGNTHDGVPYVTAIPEVGPSTLGERKSAKKEHYASVLNKVDLWEGYVESAPKDNQTYNRIVVEDEHGRDAWGYVAGKKNADYIQGGGGTRQVWSDADYFNQQ